MRILKYELDDPATRGLANFPQYKLTVEPDKVHEVWGAGLYLRHSAHTPKYYFGRLGSDQFSEMTVENVHALVTDSRTAALEHRALFVVWDYAIGFQDDMYGIYTYMFFDPKNCLKPTGHGALRHKLDYPSGVELVNGWSSNSGAINQAGFLDQHIMEVNIVTERSPVGTTMAVPVALVERLVRSTAGHYKVHRGDLGQFFYYVQRTGHRIAK